MIENKKLPIAIDFDGTVVTHEYPEIGKEIPHCIETLRKWCDTGVGIILDTMRSGKYLEDAIEWFKERDIEIYGIGKCPGQEKWTTSTKAHAVLSIDDRNLGCPLMNYEGYGVVDWGLIDNEYSDRIMKLALKYK